MLENRHYYRRARSHNRPPNGIIIITIKMCSAAYHLSRSSASLVSAVLLSMTFGETGPYFSRMCWLVACVAFFPLFVATFIAVLGPTFHFIFFYQPTRLASWTFFSPSKVKCLCRWNVKLTRLCSRRSRGWGILLGYCLFLSSHAVVISQFGLWIWARKRMQNIWVFPNLNVTNNLSQLRDIQENQFSMTSKKCFKGSLSCHE